MRNFTDVSTYTGLSWESTVNLYLLSDINVARNVMSDAEKKIIFQLLMLNIVQFLVLTCLKLMSLYVKAELDQVSKDK